MSEASQNLLPCLHAVLAAAVRQREALVTGDREAIQTQEAALAAWLAVLEESAGGVADVAAHRLAREVREQLRINAALAENGEVILGHLAAGLAAVRQDGALGGHRIDARR